MNRYECNRCGETIEAENRPAVVDQHVHTGRWSVELIEQNVDDSEVDD